MIVGTSGQYEDWMTWNVVAFLDKELCLNRLEELDAFLIRNGISRYAYEFAETPLEPFIDDYLKDHWQNYGVSYQIEELDLYE